MQAEAGEIISKELDNPDLPQDKFLYVPPFDLDEIVNKEADPSTPLMLVAGNGADPGASVEALARRYAGEKVFL